MATAPSKMPDTTVVAFLKERVPRWDPASVLSAAGLDSLDIVAMRNKFNKHFSTKLPMEVFTMPSKTLGALVTDLQQALSAN